MELRRDRTLCGYSQLSRALNLLHSHHRRGERQARWLLTGVRDEHQMDESRRHIRGGGLLLAPMRGSSRCPRCLSHATICSPRKWPGGGPSPLGQIDKWSRMKHVF